MTFSNAEVRAAAVPNVPDSSNPQQSIPLSFSELASYIHSCLHLVLLLQSFQHSAVPGLEKYPVGRMIRCVWSSYRERERCYEGVEGAREVLR